MFDSMKPETQSVINTIADQLISDTILARLKSAALRSVTDQSKLWFSMVAEIYINVLADDTVPDDQLTDITNAIEFYLNMATAYLSLGDDIPIDELSDVVNLTLERGDWWYSNLEKNLQHIPTYLSIMPDKSNGSTALFKMAVAVARSYVKE